MSAMCLLCQRRTTGCRLLDPRVLACTPADSYYEVGASDLLQRVSVSYAEEIAAA